MSKAPEDETEELDRLLRTKEMVCAVKDNDIKGLDTKIWALRVNKVLNVQMTRNEVYLLQEELKRLATRFGDSILVLSRALNEALRKDDQAFNDKAEAIRKGMENERGH